MIHWHTNHIETIGKLLLAEQSASEIGAKFGVSRNAVIGVVHRNAVLREIGFARSPGPTNKERARRERRPRQARAARPIEISLPLPPTPIVATEPHVAGITMMMLASGMCKWPVNDAARGETFLFCGTATEHGPYCQHHARRSVQHREG